MSVYHLIFAVIVGYSFLEIWFLLPPGAVVFRRRLRGQFAARPVTDTGFRVGPHWRLVFASPLPVLPIYVAESWPFVVQGGELSARPSHSVPPEPEPLSGWRLARSKTAQTAQTVELERHVVLVGARPKRRLRFSSPVAAAAAAPVLTRLLNAAASTRDELTARFDTPAIEGRLALMARAQALRAISQVLAVYLFVGLPLLWGLDLGVALAWQVVVYLALLVAAVTAMVPAHRAMFPARRLDRLWMALSMVVNPAVAINAVHSLERALLAQFHPLAVAAVLCEADELKRLGARTLRGLDHAQPSESRDLIRDSVEKLLRNHGIEPLELRRAPTAEQGCTHFCPRCLDQFIANCQNCPSCADVPLQAFR